MVYGIFYGMSLLIQRMQNQAAKVATSAQAFTVVRRTTRVVSKINVCQKMLKTR